MSDNPALEDLIRMLSSVHRELQRQSVIDPAGAGSLAESHALNRRMIVQQPAETPRDIRLILMAAEMAQWVDPHFSETEVGSALDLLRHAVAAIDEMHEKNARKVDVMMA